MTSIRRVAFAFLFFALLAGAIRGWVALTLDAPPIPIQGETTLPSGLHTAPLFPWVHLWAGQSLRTFNVLLGAITAGCWFLIAWTLIENWSLALLTGCLAALHPFWILNTLEVGDGTLASFFLSASLALALLGARHGGILTNLFFGVTLALLCLTRAALLFFAWPALFWYLGQCRPKQQGYVYALLAFVGFFGGLLPWTIENFMKYRDVYPIVDSTYHHLWLGTTTHPLDPPATVADLRRDFLHQVTSNPGDFLRRRVLAVSDFLTGREWAERPWLHAGPWSALLAGSMLAMLIGGLFGWRWSWPRREETWLIVLALLLIPLPYVLGHSERWLGARLPWDGVVLIFVAYAVVEMCGRVQRSTSGRRL